MLRRFEREAQVTAQLRSPHTVELWDFGQAGDGGFYYVMELLDGMDLDALVNRFGPVPPERAIHLLRQVCHSLTEAESKGLVHRDIKPSNLFTCRYGGDHDFVKVLDFGIVKSTDASTLETGVKVTSTMLVQGTPAFIAPEQALGGAENRRPRRHLRHRLRGLLAVDRPAGVHRRYGGRNHHPSRQHRAHPTVATLGAGDSAGPR